MEITIDLKVIGHHIQEARNQRHLTQAQVAAEIGVSDSYLSRLETGTVKMSMHRFFTIAVALQASPGDLLNGCCPELNVACGGHIASPEKEHLYELINRASVQTLKAMCAVCDALMNTAGQIK